MNEIYQNILDYLCMYVKSGHTKKPQMCMILISNVTLLVAFQIYFIKRNDMYLCK